MNKQAPRRFHVDFAKRSFTSWMVKTSAQFSKFAQQMTDYTQLELRILSATFEMSPPRDLSFLQTGVPVQLGKEESGRVFEVVRKTKETVVVRNLASGVETAFYPSEIWPASPLRALAMTAE